MKKEVFYLNKNQIFKFAGFSLMVAGILYAVVQLIHPTDELRALFQTFL